MSRIIFIHYFLLLVDKTDTLNIGHTLTVKPYTDI